MFTRSTTIRFLEISTAVVMAVLILIYIIWRSLNYIRGPKIDIFEPLNGSQITSNYFLLKGQAYRINNLLLNGSPLTIDEFGHFEKNIGTLQGINILTFEGKDRFGRMTKNNITLLGDISNTSPTTESTSTIDNSTTSPKN